MKRTISILLAMGMVVGILSGCGGDAVTQEGADTLVQQTDEPQIQMDEVAGSDDMDGRWDFISGYGICRQYGRMWEHGW